MPEEEPIPLSQRELSLIRVALAFWIASEKIVPATGGHMITPDVIVLEEKIRGYTWQLKTV